MGQYVSVPTMASLDDDINSGAVTCRLRALSADMPLCVLVVDDDALERALIADRLAERGINTLQAADGAEALAMLQGTPVQVIVVDWQMPVMDGIDDYLTKGVREPELMARIHAGMNTFSLRTQLREARAALQLAVRGREGN